MSQKYNAVLTAKYYWMYYKVSQFIIYYKITKTGSTLLLITYIHITNIKKIAIIYYKFEIENLYI